MIRISRAQMLYLRSVLPDVVPTTVNRGRRRGHRHYYTEPSEAVLKALDEVRFWAWYRDQRKARKKNDNAKPL